MTTQSLKRLARALLEYGEQMYLERTVAISALYATRDVAAQASFQLGVKAARAGVRKQFLPLYEKLEAAIADQEAQDAIEKFLKELPKGPVN